MKRKRELKSRGRVVQRAVPGSLAHAIKAVAHCLGMDTEHLGGR